MSLFPSEDESEAINKFINSDDLNDWILNNLILQDDFLEDSEVENQNLFRSKPRRNYKPPGKSQIENYFTDTEWGRMITDPLT